MLRKFFSKEVTEKDLVKGCQKGDRKSLELLYTRYSPKMFSICMRYAQNHHNAEDILQDAFVKVYKNIGKFRNEGSFEGWLRRIFVNTAIEHYRKKVSMYPILEVQHTSMDITNDHTLDKMAANELLALVQELSPGYRTIFNLYVVEGYSHREISEQLGISEGTSKSQLARARYLLQNMIRDLQSFEHREKYV